MLTLAACGDGTGPATGSLELTAHTTGRDLDPDGYTVSVDGAGATPLSPNGTATVTGLTPGGHTLTLDGVAANCVLQGSPQVPVTVVADAPVRADLAVLCAFANTLAYVQADAVYAAGIEPGSTPMRLAANFTLPSWSSDGSTLALVSTLSPSGIFLLDAGGGNTRPLIARPAVTAEFGTSAWSPDGQTLLFNYRNRDSPNHSLYVLVRLVSVDGTNGDFDPDEGVGGSISENAVWSPDGTRYAFDDMGTIYIANADGTGSHSLTRGILPVWSPDGTTLAFEVYESFGQFAQSIHTIGADGSDERNLTPPSPSGARESQPAWSPDGTQLAFGHQSTPDVSAAFMLMNGDGSGRATLAPTLTASGNLAWSFDGVHLALAGTAAGTAQRIYVVTRDGTELLPVSDDGACCPAWRP